MRRVLTSIGGKFVWVWLDGKGRRILPEAVNADAR